MIEASGRSCYTFVVGKINIAKLANFAEVECFVLVACSEASVLEDERDFHIPIVTPLELEIALGESEWCGGDSCSTDFNDFLHGKDDQITKEVIICEQDDSCSDDGDGDNHSIQDDDDDEPFFSMISGTYVSKPNTINKQHAEMNNDDEKDLQNFPGSGQLTEYKSEAAEFWKKREYKGLDANIGKDKVKPAVMGQTGIASDYGK
jgi:diphthamide biosynthesis protein 2